MPRSIGARTLLPVLAGFVCAVGILLAPPPAGADYAEGARAYEAGDLARALREWTAAAAGGDARSQFKLGAHHEVGLGVAQDFVRAYHFYDLASANGHAGADAAIAALARKMTAAELTRARSRAYERRAGEAVGASMRGEIETRDAEPIVSSPDLVAEVQRHLAEAGHDPGPIDGIMGARTVRAIRDFQDARQVPSDGEMSPALLRALRGGEADAPAESVARLAAVEPSAATDPAAPLEIGAANRVRLAAYGTLPGSAAERIFPRDTVFTDESIRTVPKGGVVIGFLDETELWLGGASEIVLDTLVFDPATLDGAFTAELGAGLFRFVTGTLRSDGFTIKTPVAAIGVRGTDFMVAVAASGAIAVTVYAGVVVVTPYGTGAGVEVAAGQTASLDAPDGSVALAPARFLSPPSEVSSTASGGSGGASVGPGGATSSSGGGADGGGGDAGTSGGGNAR